MARSRRDGTWNLGTGRATGILELLRATEQELGPVAEAEHGPPRPAT